jgi:hypothetical protein
VPAWRDDANTTYSSLSAASGGTDVSLVTTGEKATWNAKTSNTGTVTSVATGVGLAGGTITGSGTIKANLNSETSLGTLGTTSKLYAVGVDANGKLAVNVPWENSTYSLSSLGGVGSISASGTAPLTLSASKSGTTVTLTGSIAAATASAAGVAKLGASGGAATYEHTHGLSIATDSGTNQLTLAANTKYKLTAGGSTYIFTTPPDNNTWRGIQNNLTSDSTTESLSAAQGKALKALIDGKTSNTGTVTSIATGVGLAGGTITGSGTIKANLDSETSLGTLGTTSKLYAVGVDSNGKLAVNVPWTDTNTTYSFTAGTSTLAWNSEVTLATVGGLAIKAKLPANPNTNTDTLVKQTMKTDSAEYKILTTTSASPTSNNAAEAAYSTDITINPSAKAITSPNYKVTSNATITYNTTNGCLEIIVA